MPCFALDSWNHNDKNRFKLNNDNGFAELYSYNYEYAYP